MSVGVNPATRLPRGADLALSGWLLFWAGLLVVYNHAGAYAYAGLAVLLGAAGWLVLIRRTPLRGRALLLGVAWSGLFLWMFASQSWAADVPEIASQNTTPRLGAQLALMLSLPALVATRGEGARSALSHVLMATAVAGAAVMAADVATGYGLAFALDPVPPGGSVAARQSEAEMHLGRGLVAWSVLAPVVLALMAARLRPWQAWVAGALFVGLLVVAGGLNRLVVPLIILAAALPAMVLARFAPRAVQRLGLAASLGVVLFAPLVGWLAGRVPESVLARLPLSWDHRLRMWDYAAARIAEAPLRGHGMDASRAMQDSFTTRIGVDIPYISLHPHNIGLQVWLELGAVGALLACLGIGATLWMAARAAARSRWQGAALGGLVFATLAASLVTVGAWQYWFWGLVALAGALTFLLPGDDTA